MAKGLLGVLRGIDKGLGGAERALRAANSLGQANAKRSRANGLHERREKTKEVSYEGGWNRFFSGVFTIAFFVGVGFLIYWIWGWFWGWIGNLLHFYP